MCHGERKLHSGMVHLIPIMLDHMSGQCGLVSQTARRQGLKEVCWHWRSGNDKASHMGGGGCQCFVRWAGGDRNFTLSSIQRSFHDLLQDRNDIYEIAFHEGHAPSSHLKVVGVHL